MWNIPEKSRLDKIPRLYATEHIPLQDKLIYLHFFIGGSNWYVAEFDGDDLFFGYVVLNGDLSCAEWGYFSFAELKEIRVGGWCEVDCELEECWEVKVFSVQKRDSDLFSVSSALRHSSQSLSYDSLYYYNSRCPSFLLKPYKTRWFCY